MTEFSSVIPFKKSPCCFASPRGSKSVVLQFVNDTVLKNWKQVKQVRYPRLRYQTIKQVGHLVIYTNLMLLVVACVAGGICFGDLATRRLACVARVSVSFRRANKDFGFLAAREMEQAPFFIARSLTLVPRSLLRNRTEMLTTQTARRLASSQKIERRFTRIKPSLNGLQCRLPMQKKSRKNAARYARYNDCKVSVLAFKQNLYVSTRFTIVLHYHQLTWYN